MMSASSLPSYVSNLVRMLSNWITWFSYDFQVIFGILGSSVSDSDPDPLHLAGSGSTSIPAPNPDPDPLRFLSSDPDPDPLKKALIWIRVAPKLLKV